MGCWIGAKVFGVTKQILRLLKIFVGVLIKHYKNLAFVFEWRYTIQLYLSSSHNNLLWLTYLSEFHSFVRHNKNNGNDFAKHWVRFLSSRTEGEIGRWICRRKTTIGKRSLIFFWGKWKKKTSDCRIFVLVLIESKKEKERVKKKE